MKYFVLLLFMFYSLFNVSANSDTLKKLSYGLQLNTFTYSKWESEGKENLTGVMRDNKFFDITGGKSDYTEMYDFFSCYNGLFFGYTVNRFFFTEISVAHSYEKILGVRLTETVSNGNISQKYLSRYILNFVQVPFRVGVRFFDVLEDLKNATFISCGLNFDFVFIETNNYGNKSYVDSNGNIIPFSQEKLVGNGKDNFRFNKISPFIYVGREKFNKKETFSFRYGSMVVFKSFYQKHNTGEYLKNYKISPLIIGFAYHF